LRMQSLRSTQLVFTSPTPSKVSPFLLNKKSFVGSTTNVFKPSTLSSKPSRFMKTRALANQSIIVDPDQFVQDLWPHKFLHDLKNIKNEKIGSVELDSEVFKVPVRPDIIHRIVTWQLANKRRGTASAKTRAEVSGSNKKPFKQKGTGRARAGTFRAPHMRGGGVAFPPKPRDWSYSLPKKVLRMGLKSVLSAKLAEGKLTILDSVQLSSHKTKGFLQTVVENGWDQGGVLIIDDEKILDKKLKIASSNIQSVRVMAGASINIYDILKKKHLVLTKACVEYLQNKRLNQ